MLITGSYIPAQFCSMRPIDRLFSRIGSDDSIEESASSFMMEMRETAYIVQVRKRKSVLWLTQLITRGLVCTERDTKELSDCR